MSDKRAVLLERAAHEIRRDWSSEHASEQYRAYNMAVANMLAEAARTVEALAPWDWTDSTWPTDATGATRPELQRALVVACMYLGEESA